jgi:hypothetical protein
MRKINIILLLLIAAHFSACGNQKSGIGLDSGSSTSAKKKKKGSDYDLPSYNSNSNKTGNGQIPQDIKTGDANCGQNLPRLQAVAQYCGPTLDQYQNELSRSCATSIGAIYNDSCFGLNDSILQLKKGCSADFQASTQILPSSCQSAINSLFR